MTARRFYHSLRFKITVGVAVPLLIILATISYLQYNSHRDLMVENLRLSASNAGDIIEASLQHAMLTNDFSEVQQILDEIVKAGTDRDVCWGKASGHGAEHGRLYLSGMPPVRSHQPQFEHGLYQRGRGKSVS
jgi:hypothetical protein